jgi:quinolinate synthase
MTEETEREGRIVKLEVTLSHVVANQERLEDKIDKNHDEVMLALKERRCPSMMCKEHEEMLDTLKQEQDKIKVYLTITAAFLTIFVPIISYYLIDKYG